MSENLTQYTELFTSQFKGLEKKIDGMTISLNKAFTDFARHNERQKNEALKLVRIEDEVIKLKSSIEDRKVIDNKIQQTQVLQAKELEVVINKCQTYNKIASAILIAVLSSVIYAALK